MDAERYGTYKTAFQMKIIFSASGAKTDGKKMG